MAIYKHGGAARAKKERNRSNLDQMMPPETYKVTSLIEQLLHLMNVDWTDPNFTETPERVSKAMNQTWFSGYGTDPKQVLATFPNQHCEGDLVVVKDMPFYSTCAHHLAPFFGKAAVAYVPDELVVGLSKPSRLIDVFARRLQLQELITKQVADAFDEIVKPKGVMVILYNVTHTCMTSRGVQAHGSTTTTSAVRGLFSTESALRSEALSLIQT